MKALCFIVKLIYKIILSIFKECETGKGNGDRDNNIVCLFAVSFSISYSLKIINPIATITILINSKNPKMKNQERQIITRVIQQFIVMYCGWMRSVMFGSLIHHFLICN